MTASLQNDMKAMIRDIPDFPKKGILFKDITPLLKDPRMLQRIIYDMADVLKDKQIDYLVGIESRGAASNLLSTLILKGRIKRHRFKTRGITLVDPRTDRTLDTGEPISLAGRPLKGMRVLGTGEKLQQTILRVIGILAFVNQQIPKPTPVIFRYLRNSFKQTHRQYEKIIEIDRVNLAQLPFVRRVYLGDNLVTPRRDRVVARTCHILFCPGNAGVHRPWLQTLPCDICILHTLFDNRQLIVGVKDGEPAVATVPDQRQVGPQKPRAG